MSLEETLEDRANAVINLRAALSEFYNRGESDPATDRFKSADAAYCIALENFRETATPEIVLELIVAARS